MSRIGKMDDQVLSELYEMLSDDNPSVRGSAADELASIVKADDRLVDKLCEMLSDGNASVRWGATYALISPVFALIS
jgi:HEAT repeat protein